MNSVFLKSCLRLAGLVVLSFFVFLTSFAIILREQTIAEKQAGLIANANSVQEMYQSFANFDPNNPSDLEMVGRLVSIVTLPHNQMMVADADGFIVACSLDSACARLGFALPLDFRHRLSVSGHISALTTLPGLVEESSYIFATRIVSASSGAVVGYVLVASGSDIVMEEWGAMLSLFLFVAALVVLAAIVLAMFLARHQAAPLREMSLAATKFAHGDFSSRVSTAGREDEIGELASAFNAMADSIEQSENMRREFIGNVSHELKTPMTSITGFAEGMLDGTIPAQKHPQYLEIVVSETKRLSRLVLRMLEVARFQAMDIRDLHNASFDLTEVIRRCLLSLESKICEKGLDISLDIPEQSLMVFGDSDSIMQVIYNLVDNATKFSYRNTTIVISLDVRGTKAQVSVENTGREIDEAQLSLLFNRFHKSDKARSDDAEGVGLGLYIAKTIMNAHREDIYVRSDCGKTTFMFTLTIAPKKKKEKEKDK